MITQSNANANASGIATLASPRTAQDTVEALKSLIDARQLTLFALIDFSGDARRAGLTMPFSQMLIFGNPRAGTPLMQAVPTAALDLPLKVLVWEDAEQRVWISYNAPEYLQQRHQAPPSLMTPLAGVVALVNAVAESR